MAVHSFDAVLMIVGNEVEAVTEQENMVDQHKTFSSLNNSNP